MCKHVGAKHVLNNKYNNDTNGYNEYSTTTDIPYSELFFKTGRMNYCK